MQGKLRRFIGGAFDDDDGSGGPGGWWIFLEVDVRLSPHDIVRPDLAGWRRERLASPWDERPIDVVPDWICEIISTSNAGHDRVTKRELYARHGVAHYWLADPSAGTLETIRLDQQSKRSGDAGAFDVSSRARIPPFEAIELDLSRVFPPPVPGEGRVSRILSALAPGVCRSERKRPDHEANAGGPFGARPDRCEEEREGKCNRRQREESCKRQREKEDRAHQNRASNGCDALPHRKILTNRRKARLAFPAD